VLAEQRRKEIGTTTSWCDRKKKGRRKLNKSFKERDPVPIKQAALQKERRTRVLSFTLLREGKREEGGGTQSFPGKEKSASTYSSGKEREG